MFISLIICTYERTEALKRLLQSLQEQSCYPDEILIIDGSYSDNTQLALENIPVDNLLYFRVKEEERGLTRQRNYGIKNINPESDVVFFLDDDVIPDKDYIQEIVNTYRDYPGAKGVGGYIINEVKWFKKGVEGFDDSDFEYDGWKRNLGKRYGLRKKFGLTPDTNPGFMPESSHGFPIHFLPPSGKVYQVEFFMGGVASYRAEVFKDISFSSYFEGYGLYEDMDFCLRLSAQGNLYVNTKATLSHYHESSGRPNMFKYGKMVLRNGWYVWRVKYPSPSLKAAFKWHATEFLLILVRMSNILNTKDKKDAFTESLGRMAGWGSLIINKPDVRR